MSTSQASNHRQLQLTNRRPLPNSNWQATGNRAAERAHGNGRPLGRHELSETRVWRKLERTCPCAGACVPIELYKRWLTKKASKQGKKLVKATVQRCKDTAAQQSRQPSVWTGGPIVAKKPSRHHFPYASIGQAKTTSRQAVNGLTEVGQTLLPVNQKD